MSGPAHDDHETVSRYDLVLGVIPGAYAVGVLAQAVLSVSLFVALAVASAIAITVLVDGLVVHPPV
jgi:hypothetical protein